MSAKEHDHDHDHGHDHHHHHDDEAPQAPLPATPSHGYWKSLRELEGKAAWQVAPTAKEFPPGADQPPPLDPMSRRNFFHLMGASMGLAGLGAAAGCRRYEKEEIVPLSRRPEDQVPGTTLQYATMYELGGIAHALVATSFEGRPIHLDGNPEHPFAGGGIVAGTTRHAGAHTFAQAAILHLYDPDRSQSPLQAGIGATMDAFKLSLDAVRKLIETGGARVLSEATTSPTVKALRDELVQKHNVGWHEYEAVSWDNERAGMKLAFGTSVRPMAKLDQCKTIVTIDCDIFVEHPAAMRYSRDFARRRRQDGSTRVGPMNRLYSIESTFSNTGAMADHRLPLRAELSLAFVRQLDWMLNGGVAPDAECLKEEKVAKYLGILAKELKGASGRAVLLAGRRRLAPEVHAYVAKVNASLNAVGNTLDYVDDLDRDRPSHVDSIAALAKDMHGGRVPVLVILGGNPVYDAPADLDFAGALAKVGTSIHLSEYADETSLKTSWHVPKAHFLEAWGDARTWDGTITLAQPLIAPMYGGLTPAEMVSLLLGREMSNADLITKTRQAVHDGFMPNSAFSPVPVTLGTMPARDLRENEKSGTSRPNGKLEAVFHYSSFTYDGRFSNNAWLWETPDFMTKVVWDNYVLISPATAIEAKVENDTMVTVKIGERSLDLPCYVMPGQARSSIGIVLGGGRTHAGHVSTHPKNVADDQWRDNRVVGWDTYTLRTTAGFGHATDVTVTATGKKYELANIQEHWSYKPGRAQDDGQRQRWLR